MANTSLRSTCILVFSFALAACGGGSGDDSGLTAATSTGAENTTGTGAQSPPPSPGLNSSSGGSAGGSGSDFTATLVSAPADEGTISGPTRLEVRGSGMENAELLPPDSYAPRLGVFNLSGDKTLAWIDFDGGSLPNGTLRTRILAFDVPPGASGREIVAMSTRTWRLRNDPQPRLDGPIPPPSLMPEVWLQLEDLPWVDPEPLNDMMRLDDAAYQALMSNEAQRVRQTMYSYIPAHVLLFPAPRGFTGPWYACVQQPAPAACREAMNLTIGLMNGKAR